MIQAWSSGARRAGQRWAGTSAGGRARPGTCTEGRSASPLRQGSPADGGVTWRLSSVLEARCCLAFFTMSAIPVDVIAKEIDDQVDAVGSHAMVVNAISGRESADASFVRGRRPRARTRRREVPHVVSTRCGMRWKLYTTEAESTWREQRKQRRWRQQDTRSPQRRGTGHGGSTIIIRSRTRFREPLTCESVLQTAPKCAAERRGT